MKMLLITKYQTLIILFERKMKVDKLRLNVIQFDRKIEYHAHLKVRCQVNVIPNILIWLGHKRLEWSEIRIYRLIDVTFSYNLVSDVYLEKSITFFKSAILHLPQKLSSAMAWLSFVANIQFRLQRLIFFLCGVRTWVERLKSMRTIFCAAGFFCLRFFSRSADLNVTASEEEWHKGCIF